MMQFGEPLDPSETEGLSAKAGKPLAEGATIATEEQIADALREVYDPEIPVNIYDLGLIYDINIGPKGNVKITMTLTAPGCPVAGEMPYMAAEAVTGVEGVGEVEVTLTWEPPWSMELMSEDARMALGLF